MKTIQDACILFRKIDDSNEDVSTNGQFKIYNYITQVPKNNLVIGRYSTLPYYEEVYISLKINQSYLINSIEEHLYIANIMNWYEDLKQFTPKTYTEWGNLPENGKWIVKGKTNSRKQHWNTHMFADGREKLLKVIRLLMEDVMLSEQGLVIREYTPLKKLDEGINGLPIVKEWRLFYLKENFIAGGFYWSNFYDELKDKHNLSIPNQLFKFANKVAKIVSKKTNFFVLDIAQKEDGEYILIEINDGQQSGLSTIDPTYFYGQLNLNVGNMYFNIE